MYSLDWTPFESGWSGHFYMLTSFIWAGLFGIPLLVRPGQACSCSDGCHSSSTTSDGQSGWTRYGPFGLTWFPWKHFLSYHPFFPHCLAPSGTANGFNKPPTAPWILPKTELGPRFMHFPSWLKLQLSMAFNLTRWQTRFGSVQLAHGVGLIFNIYAQLSQNLGHQRPVSWD